MSEEADLIADIGKLVASHGEGYFVGGCVRDTLLGAGVKDIDFVIAGDTHALGRSLAKAYRGHVFFLREEEGVVRVMLPEQGGLQIDLCPLHGTLEEDLRARDLTINALAAPAAEGLRPDGTVIDVTRGRADLAARMIRFAAADAPERDPLRTMRALRFRWKLNFTIEDATLARVRECVPLLSRVSGERIRDELFMLLAMTSPAEALADVLEVGAAQWIFGRPLPHPDVAAAMVDRVRELAERLASLCHPTTPSHPDRSGGIWPENLRDQRPPHEQRTGPKSELAALLAREVCTPRRRREVLLLTAAVSALPAAQQDPALVCKTLALSGDERHLITKALAAAPGLRGLAERSEVTGRERLRALQAAGHARPEAVLLAAGGGEWDDAFESLLNEALDRLLRPPEPLLTGLEVMELLGLKPGPSVGRVLASLEDARADGLIATAEEARAWLQRRPSQTDEAP